MEGYYTVDTVLTYEQTIEKSRFIGIVMPVSDVDEVRERLSWVKETYPNARHYVYAYRLLDGRIEKSSDDGEPQGTGGRPVLELLKNRQVWNVLIVVVRYFGGILLGTGGLTRAYGGTARLALEQKPLVLLTPHRRYRLTVPYSLYDAILYQLRQQVWEASNAEFAEQVTFNVDVPIAEADVFERWIGEYSGGQVAWKAVTETYKRPLK